MAGGGQSAGFDRAGRLQTLRPADHLSSLLSLRYERRRAELDAALADPDSDYYTGDAKAALSVNRELIQLYWGIGRDMV